jgi:hypothetical protein
MAKNEKTRAVGNMKVNARGDTIDSHGRIITPVTEKVNTAYSKTVGNKSANVNRKPTQQLQPDPIIKEMDLTAEERELEDSLGDDLEVEKIKQAELKEKKK